MKHFIYIFFLLLFVSCKSTPKFLQCDNCDGDGEIYVECYDCDGYGYFKCRECEGYGMIECDECYGRGRLSCSRCFGSGRGGMCIFCSGNGYDNN